ncbi:unnamed protein product [Acanthosepion pharaonis]|uniref:Uncharacterized protein n=1 Tax=Acanthosepion pharaonis TaxID=158019 RepID=A0A812EGM6_ACAPH|nr:unnamed protein product [Sepia pharaonis]
MSLSQIPSSNHTLSLVCLWNSFPPLHYESLKFLSQIPSSNHALLFFFVAFGTLSLHQSHYESLKFRHLITLNFRWLIWNSFPSIKAIMSLNSGHLITLYFRLLPLDSFPSIKAIMVSQIQSSNHAQLSLVAFGTLFPPSKPLRSLPQIPSFHALSTLFLHQSHYESLKFRHLITLYFRWLPLEPFFLHQSHYESLKFLSQIPSSNHAQLSLVAFGTLFLHQSHMSLKFRHLITLYFSLVAFETLFPPSKPYYESLKFRHLITLYFRWLHLNSFPLHQSHYESLKFVI